MGSKYRVVDLSAAAQSDETLIDAARSPEDAAFKATGEKLVRSGRPGDLRVRVYFQQDGQPVSMVRLYRRVEDRP
jgi:hypothetical protein